MKKIILGFFAILVLCGLAYYSSYLYTDHRYEAKLELVEENIEPEEPKENIDESEIEQVVEEKAAVVTDSEVITPQYEEEPEYLYYILEEFGEILIYESDLETVYEYTEIKFADLPVTLQDEIIFGKGIESEAELYDFLENYSS